MASATGTLALYNNEVLEFKITDIANSKIDHYNLFTVDNSLATNAGLKKVIHKYTYDGKVEQLAKGAKNTVYGDVSLAKVEYEVKRYQQAFKYNDMDVMTDPNVINVLTNGAGTTMANEIRDEYYTELEKITNTQDVDALDYEAVVDAIASLGDVELDTQELFILMGVDGRQAIRKDAMFEASKQGEILYTGQFGTVAGIPCVFTNLVPEGKAYITAKDAITFFVKNAGSVEQDRDIETKDNTVVYERHGIMALTDETRSVVLNFGD